MNQILYTDSSKKTKGGTLEISSIVRIFAILCIIFGVFLVGQASFAMINQEEEVSENIPLVETNQNGNILNIKVDHDKIIDKIIYSWNKGKEVTLLGKGRKNIEEKINIPVGQNLLTLKVYDINGKVVSYNENYEVGAGDTIKPEIELLVENSKVKITVKDETALNYIEYYWNSEEGTKIYARQDSSKQIEEKIDILKGENTLTIIAVDEAGNESIKEQTFKGVKKPSIELAMEGRDLIIKVTDEEEIQKIEYTLNGKLYSTDASNTGESLGMKELVVRQPIDDGENKITVKAYNINGLQEEVSAQPTI